MHIDKNLQFITSKILDTKFALFHCHINSLLRINSTIIQTLKVDSESNILFFIIRPPQLINQFDQEFPVGLKYYRKGSDYSLHISGKATMLTDPEELSWNCDLTPEEVSEALCSKVLIKVKIIKVAYYDHYRQKTGILDKVKSKLYSLLDWAEPNGRSYDFSNGNHIHYGF
jgi:hypothetical protein